MSNFNVEKFLEETERNKKWLEYEKSLVTNNTGLKIYYTGIMTSLTIVRNCVVAASNP